LTGGIVAAIIIGVSVFFLSVPLDLYFRFEAEERFHFVFRLSWLFGRVKMGSEKRKKKSRAKAGRQGRGNWSFLWGLLRTRGLASRLWQLARGVLRHLKIRDLEVDFEVSLGDPADTALLVGGLWLPAFLAGTQTGHRIRVVPVFDDDLVLHGRAHISLRLIPIQLVPVMVRFGLSQAGRKIIGVLVFRRWQRKQS
jgi:hypothetical protein